MPNLFNFHILEFMNDIPAQNSRDSQVASHNSPNQQTSQQPEQVATNSQQEVKKKPKLLKFLFPIILITLILVSSFLSYTIAYEKVKITKFPKATQTIRHFVQGLPLTPKTPKYLLEKSTLAHQKVTKHSFDVSAALDSNELASSLGLGNLDLEAKGAVDYTDAKNLILDMNTSITRDFNFEVKKKDALVYFKVNKLPLLITTFLGLQPEQLDPLLNKWVTYNTSTLDTQARREIETETTTLSAKFIDETIQKYFDDNFLTKTKVETVEENGIKLYKLTITADANLIDSIGKKLAEESAKNLPPLDDTSINPNSEPNKLSDTVKSLKWEIYIGKKTYLTRKVVMLVKLELDQTAYSETSMPSSIIPSLSGSSVNFSLVAKFADFGKPVTVQIPQDATTFEEFSMMIMEMYMGNLEDVTTQ